MQNTFDIHKAISHLADAYLLISGVREVSVDTSIQIGASVALVHISQAQEKAFEIKAALEVEEE